MKISATNTGSMLAATVLCAGLWHNAGADVLRGLDCIVQPYTTVELSSSVAGVIESINVDRSDTVRKGEVLANLESDVEQVKYNMAKARAKYDGDLKSSKVNLAFNDREYRRVNELYREKVVSMSEKDKVETNLEMARFEHDRVVHENEVLELELGLAKANLELRQITSPIDGVVVDRYMTPGEYVENKPVLKVAQLHPLRIELIASVQNFGKIRTGMHARVIPEFGDYDELVAEVVVVDKVIDAASGTFGVRLLLDNVNHEVPGGLKCRLDFLDAKEEAAYLKRKVSARAAVADGPGIASGPAAGRAAIDTDAAGDFGATAGSCATLSGWKYKSELEDVLNRLDDLVSSSSIQQYSDKTVNWQVRSEEFDSRQAARAMLDEVGKKGIRDVALMSSDGKLRVSFGLFTSKQSALQRQARISGLGYQVEIAGNVKSRDRYRAEVHLTNGADYQTIASRLKNADDLASINLRQCDGRSPVAASGT